MNEEMPKSMNTYRLLTKDEISHPLTGHISPIMSVKDGIGLIEGTAVLIAPGFAMTASHVIKSIFDKYNLTMVNDSESIIDIYVINFLNGAIWYISHVFSWVGTDIALLKLTPRNDKAKQSIIKPLSMTVDPPIKESEIIIIGYPNSNIVVGRYDAEATELRIEINPTVSTGRVTEIYGSQRDSIMVRFPSFACDAKSEGGISGGAVFNSNKELCGLLSTSINTCGDDKDCSYSVAASIWPALIIPFKLEGEDSVPSGLCASKNYRLLDLAKIGFINIKGYERIEIFKHDNGSDGIRRYYPLDVK